MEPAAHQTDVSDISHNATVSFNHVLLLLNVRMNRRFDSWSHHHLSRLHFAALPFLKKCPLFPDEAETNPCNPLQFLAVSKQKFECRTFLIMPASTHMVAKNVFTQTREALWFKSPAGPRANCARSRRASWAGRNSLVFPASCSNVSAPSARTDWPLSSSSSWIQTLSRTLKPSTTASPQPPPRQKKSWFICIKSLPVARQAIIPVRQSAHLAGGVGGGGELGGGAATAFPQRTRAFQITPASNLLIHL